MPLRPLFLVRRGRADDDSDAAAEATAPPAAASRFPAPAPRLRRRPRVPDRAFAAVTVVPVLLALAWLAPGTGMLLAGRLLPLPMVIIFVPLAVTLCYSTMGRLPARWPRFGAAEPAAAPGGAGRGQAGPALALLAMAAVAAGFGIWQAAYRSEQVFVTSDPGVYLHYGYWIAGHGTARIPVPAAAFGGATGLDFASQGFTVSGGSIRPAFLPGLPLMLAGGTWLGGLGGALLMPAVLGGCAVLSFGGLVGRLCGLWWAVAGELVLAVGLPEVYTSRAPFNEPLVQVLLFGGLCLFIDSLVTRRGVLAALGGLALGLTVLASVASVGVLLPALPVLALLLAARRPQAWPFGAVLVAGTGTGLVTGLVLARPYLSTVSAPLRLIGLCVFGYYALSALVLLLAFPAVRARVRRAGAYRVRVIGFRGEVHLLPSLAGLAQWLALVLPAAAAAGLAERPLLQTVRGQADPAMIRAVAALQRMQGLPADGLRQYYESSGHWVLWYLGAPALLLACAGAALLGRRSVETAFQARPRSSAILVPASLVELWGLPLAIVAWSVLTVLWNPFVVPWQPMASHRLAPAVLPGIVLLGLCASSWLVSRAAAFGAARAALAVAGTCCVLALALPPLVTTLNPGPANRSAPSAAPTLGRLVQLSGAGASATYGGSLAAASALCAAIGPSASVLVTDRSTAATFAPVIRGLCGLPAAAVVPGPSAAATAVVLEQAVRSVERAGRRPVVLGPTRSSVAGLGSEPRQAVSLRTAGDAESLTGPPAGTWPVSYAAWLSFPAGAGG